VTEIDPQQFGRLEAEVAALRREYESHQQTVRHISSQVDSLVAMANRSRGALWAGMSFATLFGGFLTWLGERFLR